jgi:hypothetical protein
MIRDRRGQIVPIVLGALVVVVMVVLGLVSWLQNDTNWTVKQEKTTDAINFAEAGIDRGAWKLQSATTTWTAAAAGTVIPGYNFDTTYTDIPGGTYRIKFTSGTLPNGMATVTITAEGRDNTKKEIRAVQAVEENLVIYSPMMAGGNVTWAPGFGLFWGPIMAHGNITLNSAVAQWYFPRKYATGDVIGTAQYPRDTTYPAPPNTDNVEWWANYSGVPSVPILDFAALKSSAQATGTYDIYGCANSNPKGTWDLNASCSCTAPNCPTYNDHNHHFGNSTNYIKTYLDPTKSYVWYWDQDLTLTGQFNSQNQPYNPGRSTALMGMVIVMGNLTIDSPGDWLYTGYVPANAWRQHQKLLQNTYDTAAANEYPADIGLSSSAATMGFGYTYPLIHIPGVGNGYATVGIRGFLYVDGNLTVVQGGYLDINGAVWVKGNVNVQGGSMTQFCSIFYDDRLNPAALNVILQRLSWQEVTPSTTPWN